MSALREVFKNVSSTDFRRDISQELIKSEENLKVKTDISSVSTFAILETITNVVSQEDLTETAKTLRYFTDEVYKLSLSKDRKSRTEYLEAIKSMSNIPDKTESGVFSK
jgi:hypothetical protein